MLAKTPIVALVASMASAISIEAAQLPVDAIALMFDNPDCSGTDYFKWTLHEGQDIVEADNHDLDAVGAGWHDRGEAIMVPAGFSLMLVRDILLENNHAYTFAGQEDEEGQMVCQQLSWYWRDQVSASFFIRGTDSVGHSTVGRYD